jgi:hypothetical protein
MLAASISQDDGGKIQGWNVGTLLDEYIAQQGSIFKIAAVRTSDLT